MTPDTLSTLLNSKAPIVLVRITDAKGSTPREPGAEIFVTNATAVGTIGGGRLEHMAIEAARKLLRDGDLSCELVIPLGPEIGQCCGGCVTLSLSRMTKNDRGNALQRANVTERAQPHIYILGSGHLGRALANLFQHLPFRATVVDQRESELIRCNANVEKSLHAIPEEMVKMAPPGSAFIILTHDHALDFLLTSAALERGDTAYVGLIGSKTKRAKFVKWIGQQVENPTLDALVCPIGKSEALDKRPEIIASHVVSEVVAALSRFQSVHESDAHLNDEATSFSLPRRQQTNAVANSHRPTEKTE